MGTTILTLTLVGLLFLIIFISGFWLSKSGKPYHAVVFNVHKLLGLAVFVLVGVLVYQTQHGSAFSSLEFTMIGIAAVLTIGTIISGGLVSIDKSLPTVITLIHKILPYLTVLATAVVLYFLQQHK
jgi:hypothetical protein